MLVRKHTGGAPFGSMDDTRLALEVKALIIRIHVVTGWIIPEEELGIVLMDQLAKVLRENYGNANRGEIEAAFRQNSAQVQNWGRSFNLGLLQQVLEPYFTRRQTLSLLEEQKREEKGGLPGPSVADQELVDYNFEMWCRYERLEFIHARTYEALENARVLMLEEESKKRLMAEAARYLRSKVQEDPGYIDPRVDKLGLQQRVARKLAVENLFRAHKMSGNKIVLNENKP